MSSAGICKWFTFALLILIVVGTVAVTNKFTSKRTIKKTPAGAEAFLRGDMPPPRPIDHEQNMRDYMNRTRRTTTPPR